MKLSKIAVLVAGLLVVAVTCLGTDLWSLSSTANGTATLSTDGAGTATLTVDAAVIANQTVSGDLAVTGEASIDGKYGITGGDATTGLMLQKAAVTSGTGTTHTVTFAVAFGAAPIVACTYTEDPGDVRPIWVSSVTASNFVANITADKNFGYVAVGTRP